MQITAVAGRVYDTAPADVDFPYIQIGDSDITPDDTATGIAGESDDGVVEALDLHVWGRAHAGKMEVKQVADDIHSRLHGVDIDIAGRASSLTWVRHIRVVVEPDGVTAHATIGIEIAHRS